MQKNINEIENSHDLIEYKKIINNIKSLNQIPNDKVKFFTEKNQTGR